MNSLEVVGGGERGAAGALSSETGLVLSLQKHTPIAQLVEHTAANGTVCGSSPHWHIIANDVLYDGTQTTRIVNIELPITQIGVHCDMF